MVYRCLHLFAVFATSPGSWIWFKWNIQKADFTFLFLIDIIDNFTSPADYIFKILNSIRGVLVFVISVTCWSRNPYCAQPGFRKTGSPPLAGYDGFYVNRNFTRRCLQHVYSVLRVCVAFLRFLRHRAAQPLSKQGASPTSQVHDYHLELRSNEYILMLQQQC